MYVSQRNRATSDSVADSRTLADKYSRPIQQGSCHSGNGVGFHHVSRTYMSGVDLKLLSVTDGAMRNFSGGR